LALRFRGGSVRDLLELGGPLVQVSSDLGFELTFELERLFFCRARDRSSRALGVDDDDPPTVSM
jgi:hypothetical protein